jgi:hypothetical protein
MIELEMAYTTWAGSCKEPILIDGTDERACRRETGHAGPHASGHVAAGNFVTWSALCDRFRP